METLDSDGNVVVQYIYTLGAAGERKAVTESGLTERTVEYSYDSLYRLTSENITEGDKTASYTYAYDNVSNRILKTINGDETVYTYNALNQLVSDSNTTYEYDLNGNLIRVVGLTNSALYEYNAENKLVKATVQSGNNVIVETYTYDYSGNRTSKTTNTNGHIEYVKYLNDNSSLTNVLAEIDETGTLKCVYTIGADLISQERDGKVSVYVYDGHGSVVGLSDMDGRVTDTYVYDAFGNLIKSTGKTANNYRYCGEQADSTTGLYYLRARYMDTSTGRFISQDSYQGSANDPVSLHKYLYANSNPVTYSDPSGYISFTEAAGTMAMQGALLGTCVCCFGNMFSNLFMGDTTYDSVSEAAIWGLVDGLICGALIGVAFAAFLTLIPIFAVAVAFNIASAIYYYALSKDAFISHQWYEAFVYFYTAVCCVVTGIAIAGYAEACQNAWNDFPKESGKDIGTANQADDLPIYDGKTTHGRFIADNGEIVDFESGNPPSQYANYPISSHVEGKAAIHMRENNIESGTIYHNNTNGTCGYCDRMLPTVLPENSSLTVVPPSNAVPNNSKAVAYPKEYIGNANTPKPNKNMHK